MSRKPRTGDERHVCPLVSGCEVFSPRTVDSNDMGGAEIAGLLNQAAERYAILAVNILLVIQRNLFVEKVKVSYYMWNKLLPTFLTPS